MTSQDRQLPVGQGIQEWIWAMEAVSHYALWPSAAKMIFEWAIALEEILFYGGYGPVMYDMVYGLMPEEEE